MENKTLLIVALKHKQLKAWVIGIGNIFGEFHGHSFERSFFLRQRRTLQSVRIPWMNEWVNKWMLPCIKRYLSVPRKDHVILVMKGNSNNKNPRFHYGKTILFSPTLSIFQNRMLYSHLYGFWKARSSKSGSWWLVFNELLSPSRKK